MSEKKMFHNIIGGEVQASADGAMMDIVNRRPARSTRARRTLRPSTSTKPARQPARRSRSQSRSGAS